MTPLPTQTASTSTPSSSSTPSPTAQQNTPELVVTSPTHPTIQHSHRVSACSIPTSTAQSQPASATTSRTVSASKPTIITTECFNHPPLSQTNRSSQVGCNACVVDRPYVDRIRSISHVYLALGLMLTDRQRRKHLFTNWIHVPIGITSLLFLVWLIKQAMDRAPFRFPSPVLAMVLLFVLLLALDYLSTTNLVINRFGRSIPSQLDHNEREVAQTKLLLQPMLMLLEAPCDFCLRYMSVMFTPSFILIPAREIINGREIGLITGWFAASQLLALIFPVVLHKAVRYIVAVTKRNCKQPRDTKEGMVKRVEEQRRASVATLVAVMSTINGGPKVGDGVQKAEMGSSLGVQSRREKGTVKMVGEEKLGSVATGLSGMTAIATAPLAVSTTSASTMAGDTTVQTLQRQDAQRQLEHVQLETARQQGDPYATTHTPLPEYHHHYPLLTSTPNSPRPASLLHHSSSYFPRGRLHEAYTHESEPGLRPSRSLARSWIDNATRARVRAANSVSPHRAARPRSGRNNPSSTDSACRSAKPRIGAAAVGTGSGLKNLALQSRRPQSASAASERKQFAATAYDALSPTFVEYIFQARRELIERRGSTSPRLGVSAEDGRVDEMEGSGAQTLVMPTFATPTPARLSHDIDHDEIKPCPRPTSMLDQGGVRRPSKADSELTVSNDIEAQSDRCGLVDEEKVATNNHNVTASAGEGAMEQDEIDAVDRLVEQLWNAIPWFVFTLVLIVGIPLFYTINISLPLFLGVNLLTFLASITLVPANIRRYAHPILTTSIATVLVLWAIGEIRGWNLKRTLGSYSVDAKYTVLWSLRGYNGPVIGAGDVLFSTLDAGIVSLAIPMYRYRWDLWLHLVDMLIVLFPCSMLSLFVWPTVAANIGIAPERALAFTSRFMSTPLAIELSLTIGADQSITVVLVVITGIVISIFKDPFFRRFGLDPTQDGPPPNDETNASEKADGEVGGDYLTIGIAMGSTAGAIGASSLISKPRCMAIASLSFVLFGAILLIFAAIPPIVKTLRSLALAPIEFTPAS